MVLLCHSMEIKEFNYSANFCEENIWHLCQNPALEPFAKKVLIVSNSQRNCPFRFQKSINGDEIVWWNYHVILFAATLQVSFIYDFDSTLALPISGKEYFSRTFQRNESWTEKDQPCFKVFSAAEYLDSFVSDRNHMKSPEGNWLSSPPKWPAIGKNGALPLPALLDFTESSQERIYQLDEMFAMLEAFDYDMI